MAEPGKPLHVKVAEALGWTNLIVTPMGELRGDAPGGLYMPVPRYDTEWAATGPLIEQFGIDLTLHQSGGAWLSCTNADGSARIGRTPMVAICGTILALKAAGKLNG